MKTKSLHESWKQVLSESRFRFSFIITVLMLLLITIYYTNFLDFVETRSGVVLPDPMLGLFKPIDLTWIIFSIIYLSVILALIHLSQIPRYLIIGLQAFIILIPVRMISMFLVPLDPPTSLIPLEDPFVQSMSSGLLTKDLFFSGHTSTLFLLFLSSTNKYLKVFFLFAMVTVGLSVLCQHVHYSIDVFAAPFYTYACYRASLLFNQKFLGTE